MTLTTILTRLRGIDREMQELINETGFDPDDGLDGQVCPETTDPEELFLQEYIENILDAFTELHDDISYLGNPTHGEFVLTLFPDGRYGYVDEQGNSNTFHCGKTLEAKVPVPYGHPRWVRTRIEHDGSDFYLVRHSSVPLNGLTIRERW